MTIPVYSVHALPVEGQNTVWFILRMVRGNEDITQK